MNRYARIARQSTATILESIDPEKLHTLWMEDKDGNKFIPDLSGNMPPEVPGGIRLSGVPVSDDTEDQLSQDYDGGRG